VPALGGIREDNALNHIPAKSLASPVLATVLESESEATSGDLSGDRDEAEGMRLLHGLHFELIRAEKKTAANGSASFLVEPMEIAKHVLYGVEPHSTPALRAGQRPTRGSSAAEKTVARGSVTVGSQRARVQPPGHENTCADVGSSCPGSATMVCREPSPLRTPKSNGRSSPPRRTLDVTSNSASAVATGGRSSPERQRRKQLPRTGSPWRSRAAPPAADCVRDGRPCRALSRNPSHEVTATVPAEAGHGVVEANKPGTLRLSSSRGPRRGGSPTAGLAEEGGTLHWPQHAPSLAGTQARTMQRKLSEQGAIGRVVTTSTSSSLLNGARSPGRAGRPASPGTQTCSRHAATSPAALPKLQRGQTRHKTTQSPALGSRCSSGILNTPSNSQKHRSVSPSRSGNGTAKPGVQQRPAPTQSFCYDGGACSGITGGGGGGGGSSVDAPAADKQKGVLTSRSRPTLMASAANALRQQQQQ